MNNYFATMNQKSKYISLEFATLLKEDKQNFLSHLIKRLSVQIGGNVSK